MTVASVALPLPSLRIRVVQGCLGVPEVDVQCSVTGSLASAPAGAADFAVASFASAASAAAGPPARLKALSSPVLRLQQPGGCIPVDVRFAVVPHRRWPASVQVVGTSAGPSAAQPVGCSDAMQLPNSTALVQAAAAWAYMQEVPAVHAIRCELRARQSAGSGEPGDVVAVAHAAVLTAEPALAVPTRIMVFRRTTNTLISLDCDRSATVRLLDAAVFAAAGQGSDAAPRPSSRLTRMLVPLALDTSDIEQLGAPTRLFNASVLAQHHALAAAAARLSATETRGSTCDASAASAASVTGRTIMVITLDSSSALQRPSLTVAEGASAQYAAADAEVQRAITEPGNASATDVSPSGTTAPHGCSAASRAAAASLLTSVPPPRQRLVVRVGGVRCRTLWSAPDGSQVHVETPSFAEVCGDFLNRTASAALPPDAFARSVSTTSLPGCGYKRISLQYEPELGALQASSSAASSSLSSRRAQAELAPSEPLDWVPRWLSRGPDLVAPNASYRAGAAAELRDLLLRAQGAPLARVVRCPPWCPSAVPSGAVPLAVPGPENGLPSEPSEPTWFGRLVPATLNTGDTMPAAVPGWSTDSAAALGGADLSSFSTGSGGLYYTPDCSAVGYTSVESGACSNASNPAHRRCAFSTATGECTSCPANAICPGGQRARPYPGFYAISESSGVIRPCAAPAQERCVGWDHHLDAVLCGEPYKPLSPGCTACANGWYPRDDGRCTRCPEGASGVAALLRAVGLMLGAALCVGVGIIGTTYLIARVLSASVEGGFVRAADLLLWSVLLLQVLAQVGRSAAPGLPPLIQGMFRALAALQLEDVGLPPACWRMYPFTSEVLQCSAALVVTLVIWALQMGEMGVWRQLRLHLRDVRGKSCPACCRRRVVAAARPVGASGCCLANSKKREKPTSDAVQAITRAGIGGRRCRKAAGACFAMVAASCTSGVLRRNLPLLCFGIASLLYSLLCNTVLKLLRCKTETLSLTGYAVLDRDGGAAQMTELLARATAEPGFRSTQYTVSLLATNPAYMCYSGAHKPAAVMAWLTLVVFLIGYPLSTAVLLRARSRRILNDTFRGFAGPYGGGVPRCLLIGFHGTARPPSVGSVQPGTDAAPVPVVVAVASAASSPAELSSLKNLLVTDEGSANALLARSPIFGRLAWLCCGRERAMRALALGTETPAARAARRIELRKLTAAAEAAVNAPIRGVADNLKSRESLNKSAAVQLTGRVTGSIFADDAVPAIAATSVSQNYSRKLPASSAASQAERPKGTSTTLSETVSASVATSAATVSDRGKKRDARAPVLPPPLIAGNLLAAALDASAAVAQDPWLAHWTGATYRGSAYTARHADFVLVASLAALQVFWPRPLVSEEAIARGIVTVAVLLAAAWWSVTRALFRPDAPWKHAINVGSLLLCALAAVLTHVTLATDLSAPSASDSSDVATGAQADRSLQQRLSVAVFAGCIVLIAALAWTFAASSISGARSDFRRHTEGAAAVMSGRWGMIFAAQGAANAGPSAAGGGLGDTESDGFTGSGKREIRGLDRDAVICNPLRAPMKAASKFAAGPMSVGADAAEPPRAFPNAETASATLPAGISPRTVTAYLPTSTTPSPIIAASSIHMLQLSRTQQSGTGRLGESEGRTAMAPMPAMAGSRGRRPPQRSHATAAASPTPLP